MHEWLVEWILTEDNELPGSSQVFWRKPKGRVVYTIRRKHPPHQRVWKEKLVRVLHHKAVGVTDRTRNVLL